MMKLPDVFQMRHVDHKGFTNTAKVVDGKVEVKWARGYVEHLGVFPRSRFRLSKAELFVQKGVWIVVEDKKVERGLPDEFYFKVRGDGELLKMVRKGSKYECTSADDPSDGGGMHSATFTEEYIKSGVWVICKEQSLTPEQLRSNAEFREQIAALSQSIRLNKLDIEHKENLIKSYEARKKELESKLVKESV